MTLQEFINKYTGKRVNFDGAFGAQCVDLYRFYIKEVWQLPQTPRVVGAFQIFGSLPPGFDKFTSGVPQAGDVIIWNEKHIKNGHVAVVTAADQSGFNAFQQNGPKSDTNGVTGSPCNIARYSYKNIIGWFHPKGLVMPFKQIVLGVEYNIPNQQFHQQALDHALAWINGVTKNEFLVEVDLVRRDNAGFTGSEIIAEGGQKQIWVHPDQIIPIGREMEAANNKQYSIVMLFAGRASILPNPTIDIAPRSFVDGFTVSEIFYDATWPDPQDPPAYVVGANYIIHEWMHNWYTILKAKGVAVTDDVHILHSTIYDARPDFNLSDIVLKLKPYWPLLVEKGSSMSNAVFYHKTGTPEYGFALPKSSQEALRDMAINLGREDIIRPDGSVDFAKAREVSGL